MKIYLPAQASKDKKTSKLRESPAFHSISGSLSSVISLSGSLASRCTGAIKVRMWPGRNWTCWNMLRGFMLVAARRGYGPCDENDQFLEFLKEFFHVIPLTTKTNHFLL